MGSRYIPNEFPRLLGVNGKDNYLKGALEDIATNYGPRNEYPPEVLRGLLGGPTAMAYLFLHVSAVHPELLISGQPAIHWAGRYIGGSRGNLVLTSKGCGVGEEKLAFEAVRACVSGDLLPVRTLISDATPALVGDYPNEVLYGRAGMLYLLRMVRHWVPDSAPLVERPMAMLTGKIMGDGPNWTWHGKRYLGAVHGDVGIVTQLVLTTPAMAPRLRSCLEKLLDMQLPDGNWPSSEGHSGKGGLVQFCHGAPGLVLSFQSLRPYFPALQGRIDAAVEKGRDCIWERGILRKEPSICHGILGNALYVLQALPIHLTQNTVRHLTPPYSRSIWACGRRKGVSKTRFFTNVSSAIGRSSPGYGAIISWRWQRRREWPSWRKRTTPCSRGRITDGTIRS